MALPRGQVDRFGNPIPANQSVKVFINADGTVPQQRETVKLDANIVASDDPATQATLLTLGSAPSNAISSLTKDVVATGPGVADATIQAGVVTNAKLATMAALTFKGNATGSVAAPTDIANNGTSSGRLLVPVMIGAVQSLSAASTATITVAAGAYRDIQIISRTTGGMSSGNPTKINFNADSGSNYSYGSIYFAPGVAVNAADPATFGQLSLTGSAAAQNLSLWIRIEPLLVGSCPRPYTCTFSGRGGTAGARINGTTTGEWIDSTNDITSIVITYGTAATGTIEAWGIPA